MDDESQVDPVVMDFDEDKINQAALALLYLTLHDQCRAWKGIDWDVLNRLYDLGLIKNPVSKSKSVILTAEGLAQAEAAAKSLFRLPVSGQFEYRNAKATVSPAEGATGMLCRTTTGEGYFLRVNNPDGTFTDYELRHDDLEVTISPNEWASFYVIGEDRILDHSPEVLGLKRSKE